MTNDFCAGIKNYKPQFFGKMDDFRENNNSSLRSLVGQNIRDVWCLWSLEHNEFWLDAPVIVISDKCQIELCAQKFEDFSITFDTIELDTPISWSGDTRFEFRRFSTYKSFFVKNIHIIELEHTLNDNKKWVLGGVAFSGQKHFLSVENGLDENYIRTKRINDKFIKLSEI